MTRARLELPGGAVFPGGRQTPRKRLIVTGDDFGIARSIVDARIERTSFGDLVSAS